MTPPSGSGVSADTPEDSMALVLAGIGDHHVTVMLDDDRRAIGTGGIEIVAIEQSRITQVLFVKLQADDPVFGRIRLRPRAYCLLDFLNGRGIAQVDVHVKISKHNRMHVAIDKSGEQGFALQIHRVEVLAQCRAAFVLRANRDYLSVRDRNGICGRIRIVNRVDLSPKIKCSFV
jgi:hypothetical protein